MGTPVEPGNRGVMALAASLVSLCQTADSSKEPIFLLVHRPHPDVRLETEQGPVSIKVKTSRLSLAEGLRNNIFFNVLLSFAYKICPFKGLRRSILNTTPWLRTLKKCAWVGDVRGGDSFSDIYGMKRYIQAFLPLLSVVLVKGSIVHFPQTYGPFKRSSARMIASFLLKRSSIVIARDTRSQAVAQSLVGTKLKVGLSPDVAFSLNPVIPEKMTTNPEWEENHVTDLLGINVNGLMFNGGYADSKFNLKLDYKAFLIETVTRMMDIHKGKFLLVPHVYAKYGDIESDNEACENLRNALAPEHQARCIIVTGDYDQHEIKAVIGKCSFFMGSRMHSCIAALSQNIPCIGVSYSMKFKGVFESVGAGDWIVDGEELTASEASNQAIKLYEQRSAIVPVLEKRVTEAKEKLSEVFKQIVKGNKN